MRNLMLACLLVVGLTLHGCLGASTPVSIPASDATTDLQLNTGADADATCGAATPDPAQNYLCTLCLADMPAYVMRTEAGVHLHLQTLCAAGGSYRAYEHVCPDGKRQLGYSANGGEVWSFAATGELVGYRCQTDVISTGQCPSGDDAYGDTSCSDWTGSVYTTPNTTIDCDAGHADAYVPDGKSDTDDASW